MNQQSEWLFEAPFPSREAFEGHSYSNQEDESEWLFEVPYSNSESGNNFEQESPLFEGEYLSVKDVAKKVMQIGRRQRPASVLPQRPPLRPSIPSTSLPPHSTIHNIRYPRVTSTNQSHQQQPASVLQQIPPLRPPSIPSTSLPPHSIIHSIRYPRVTSTNKKAVSHKRNIAHAIVNIQGRPPQTIQEISGEEHRPSYFNATPTGKNSRFNDGEIKILDKFAYTYGTGGPTQPNTDVRGSIVLTTERPPCRSCSDVFRQFRIKFPNVDLRVHTAFPN